MNLGYLFDITPGRRFTFFMAFMIFFVIVFFGGIILKQILRYKKDRVLKKMFRRYPKRFLGIAITGIILLIMRQQGIPLISMRFLLMINVALVFFLMGRMIYVYRKIYPQEVKAHEERREKKKYLP